MSRDANDVKLDVSPTFRRAIELWCRMYLWQADPLLRITTWLVRKSTVIRKFDHCLTVLNNIIWLTVSFSLYLSIRIYIFIVFSFFFSSDIFWFTFFADHYFWSICTMYYDFLYKQTSSVLPFVLSISISLSFYLSISLLLLTTTITTTTTTTTTTYLSLYTRLTMSAFCLTSKCLRTASFD